MSVSFFSENKHIRTCCWFVDNKGEEMSGMHLKICHYLDFFNKAAVISASKTRHGFWHGVWQLRLGVRIYRYLSITLSVVNYFSCTALKYKRLEQWRC